MAEIEQTPQAVPGEQKKEKGTLENVIGEIWDFGKKAIAIGAVVAMPYIFYPFMPTHVPLAQTTTYAVGAGRVASNVIQKKPALEGIIKDGIYGTAISYPTAEAFRVANQLETSLAINYGTTTAKAAKIGSWMFGVQPALSTSYTAYNYGFGKKFREEWWPRIKNTFYWLSLPAGINVGWLYQYGGVLTQMLVSGSLWFSFSLIQALRGGQGSLKNLFSASLSYIGGGLSVPYKLAKNSIGGFYKGFYDIGKGIGGFIASYKPSAPAQPAAPAPSSAQAPAPAH